MPDNKRYLFPVKRKVTTTGGVVLKRNGCKAFQFIKLLCLALLRRAVPGSPSPTEIVAYQLSDIPRDDEARLHVFAVYYLDCDRPRALTTDKSPTPLAFYHAVPFALQDPVSIIN